jgi:hypothetical protein
MCRSRRADDDADYNAISAMHVLAHHGLNPRILAIARGR